MHTTQERPILFSGAMVRAILDGSKTQTRRVAKPVKHPDLGDVYAPGALVLEREPQHVIDRACPYGQPGDRLYVRETWAQPTTLDPGPTFYRADYPDSVLGKYENLPPAEAITWKPSIHMPRALSRILLEITGVRVERLNDCSEADARAEGIAPELDGWTDYSNPSCQMCPNPVDSYRTLWDSINGAGAWAANPWVWVVEFRRIQP